ncbi:MAG: NADH-quinone oxidoreductase subunit N [Rhodobacterales bacterium]|nr:MAG: NADH-quinone oxidoreductase subunit N [Rhodobacterales bacterium]
MKTIDILILGPEILLIIYSIIAILTASFLKSNKSYNLIFQATVIIFLISALILYFTPFEIQTNVNGIFIRDTFSKFFQILILLSVSCLLFMSKQYLQKNNLFKPEYPILIIFSTLGMMIMISSNNFLLLYLGLEIQSLSLYVVSSFRRDNYKSTEAGLKYFILGSLSSGLMLFGISLIYGSTGSINFEIISSMINYEGFFPGIVAGLVFLICGFAFKASAVPFHMWTPDVYEGSPTPVTAFFATVPKLAAVGVLLRVLFDCFGPIVESWQQVIIIISVLSMFLGSVAAIGQNNIKRLMAYSSIGHIGFVLMGVASGTDKGISAVLIYMVLYIIMNIGVFVFILNMERNGVAVTTINSLNMYNNVSKSQTLFLTVLLFSLAGIPPLAGFFGKFFIFNAAINAGLSWLAVMGGIASVIAAFYYLRIVYLMYFGLSTDPLSGKMPTAHWIILFGSALLMLIGIINLYGLEKPSFLAATSLIN